MSFGLPAVKVKPEREVRAAPAEGPYGVPSAFTSGISSTRANLAAAHPLEFSEKNWQANEDRMNLQMLRNTQGLHAPLKITMELKAASRVGRLPFLASSNMMREILTGRYIDIGFEDYLSPPEFCEVAGQPHAVMERSLHIL